MNVTRRWPGLVVAVVLACGFASLFPARPGYDLTTGVGTPRWHP
jgi:hypothetical protein